MIKDNKNLLIIVLIVLAALAGYKLSELSRKGANLPPQQVGPAFKGPTGAPYVKGPSGPPPGQK